MEIVYFTRPLNGLLMIAIPLALAIYLTRRFRLGWRLWWIGAVMFVLSLDLHSSWRLNCQATANPV